MHYSWLMSHHSKLPEYVILDVDHSHRIYESRLASLVLGMIPIDDGDVYKMILTTLQRDEDVGVEIDALGIDILEELYRINPYEISLETTQSVRQLAHHIHQQCLLHRLYHAHRLNYGYFRHDGGQLILRKHPFIRDDEASA